MSRPPQLALAFALALAGLAPTPSFADLSLSVAEYDSPTFARGSSFILRGGGQMISLTPGVAQDVVLDSGYHVAIAHTGQTFTGTATSDITLGGITESISYGYSLGATAPSGLTLTGGSAIVFDFGTYEVTVTPTTSTDFHRHASFLETATAAVPEPSSLWVAAVGGAAFAGYGLRRRVKKRGVKRGRKRKSNHAASHASQ
jgi:hypothetical protein